MKPNQYFSSCLFLIVSIPMLYGCTLIDKAVSAGAPPELKDFIYKKTLNPVVEKIYLSKINEAKAKEILLTEGEQFEKINTLFNQLILAAQSSPNYGRQAKNIDWTLSVIDDQEIENAFAWPGGKVLIYTGLFNYFVKTDAELAAILGHEISHLLEQHVIKRIEVNLKNIGFPGVAALRSWDKIKQNPELSAALLAALGIAAKAEDARFSRNHEKAADVQGLFLLSEAGYHPDETTELWNRLKVQKSEMISYFDTHPNGEERSLEIEKNKSEAIARYNNAQDKKKNARLQRAKQ